MINNRSNRRNNTANRYAKASKKLQTNENQQNNFQLHPKNVT
mgnify:CR=1 FL=1